MPKIKVYLTQISECCGPIVYDNASDVLEELHNMIDEIAEGDTFTVTVDEMERAEFDNLEEFDGY